jgi:hypothetical protein
MKAETLLRENFEKGIPYPSKIEEIAHSGTSRSRAGHEASNG